MARLSRWDRLFGVGVEGRALNIAAGEVPGENQGVNWRWLQTDQLYNLSNIFGDHRFVECWESLRRHHSRGNAVQVRSQRYNLDRQRPRPSVQPALGPRGQDYATDLTYRIRLPFVRRLTKNNVEGRSKAYLRSLRNFSCTCAHYRNLHNQVRNFKCKHILGFLYYYRKPSSYRTVVGFGSGGLALYSDELWLDSYGLILFTSVLKF